ncbi:MAG: type II secretion system protein N [Gammaproteobacteria bacterium]
MNINFFNVYNKSVDFFSNKTKTIFIAIVALILSFETSNVILEIVFSDKPVLNQSSSTKIQGNKIAKNPFLTNNESQGNSNALLNAIKAPETSLSLKLFGVTSSEDKNFAIIGLNKSDQKEYQAGDRVLDNVFLDLIHKDYVTINRSGVSESLSFNKPNLISGIETETLKDLSNKNDNIISAEWLAKQDLLDVISFVPIFSDGALSGLEVNPGDNEEFFSNLELLPGDILVSINGLLVSDLTENYSSNLETLFKEPKDLNLEILRNNNPISIGITIN